MEDGEELRRHGSQELRRLLHVQRLDLLAVFAALAAEPQALAQASHGVRGEQTQLDGLTTRAMERAIHEPEDGRAEIALSQAQQQPLMSTASGSASACTRAATLGVSPNTSAPAPAPMTTGPVCIPTRTASRTPWAGSSRWFSSATVSMRA